MTSRCIYCQNPLIPGADDGRQPSLEHIVQYAIGGSDGLATRDVCNACNSTLGDTVDARFIHNQLIGLARLQHDLEGHGGTVSDVSVKASTATNKRAEIKFKRNGQVEFRHRPEVVREILPSGSESVTVAGGREDARKIAEGLLAKAKKSKATITTASGRPVTTVDQLLDESEVETFDSYKGEMTLQMTDIYAGMAKIAFGFAHLAMGPAWTFSPVAEPLRKVARGEATPGEAEAVLKGGDKALRALFRDPADGDASHVVGLIPGGSTRVLVSLFGGDAMTYAVDVGQLVDLVDADRFGAVIDLTTRKTRWVGLAEVASRVSAGCLARPDR